MLTIVVDEEDGRPIVTRRAACRGLETAVSYLEQEGQGESAIQVADVWCFLDTKVG